MARRTKVPPGRAKALADAKADAEVRARVRRGETPPAPPGGRRPRRPPPVTVGIDFFVSPADGTCPWCRGRRFFRLHWDENYREGRRVCATCSPPPAGTPLEEVAP